MQETLEDIDKNGDGYVDEDEYIGKLDHFKKNNLNDKDHICVQLLGHLLDIVLP